MAQRALSFIGILRLKTRAVKITPAITIQIAILNQSAPVVTKVMAAANIKADDEIKPVIAPKDERRFLFTNRNRESGKTIIKIKVREFGLPEGVNRGPIRNPRLGWIAANLANNPSKTLKLFRMVNIANKEIEAVIVFSKNLIVTFDWILFIIR